MSRVTTTSSGAKRRPKLFYGWWIVLAASVQQLYTSSTFFYGFSALFNPIVHEFGWSRAATATALSLQRTESGIAGPFIGFVVDRYGARGIMVVGTVVTALGFFFLARIHSLVTFYLAFGVIALGLSLGSSVAATVVVGNWFIRQRSRAMTIAFAGGGLGGVAAPLMVWAIARYTWRPVVDWIGLGTLIVGIPVSLVMRHRPEPYGYLPDGQSAGPSSPSTVAPKRSRFSRETKATSGQIASQGEQEVNLTVSQMLRVPAFWLLALGMGVSGMVMSTAVIFSIPGLESFGISSEAAGLTLLFLSVFNVAGRFVLGFLGDMVDKRYVLAATYLMMALGVLAFSAVHSAWQVVFFLLLYAPGHGGTVPVRFAILADYFGRRSYGALIGITTTLTAVFGVIGPVFTGWVFDVTGSYRWAFIIMGILALPLAPLTLMIKRPAHIKR